MRMRPRLRCGRVRRGFADSAVARASRCSGARASSVRSLGPDRSRTLPISSSSVRSVACGSTPVTTIVRTASSNDGYYLFAEDGGVFAFGDAVFRGSLGELRLNGPIVDGGSPRARHGYYMVGARRRCVRVRRRTVPRIARRARARSRRSSAIETPRDGAGYVMLGARRRPVRVRRCTVLRFARRRAPAASPRSGSRFARRATATGSCSPTGACSRSGTRPRSGARRRLARRSSRSSRRPTAGLPADRGRRRRVRVRRRAVPRLGRRRAPRRVTDRRRRGHRVDGDGYWMLGRDGGVFTLPERRLCRPAARRPSRSRRSRPASTIPWDLGFLPDGTMLFTERPGRIDALVGGQAACPRDAGRRPRGRRRRDDSASRSIPTSRRTADLHVLQHDRRRRPGRRVDGRRGASTSATRVGHAARRVSREHQRTPLGCRPRVGPDGFLWIGTGDAATGHQPAEREQPRRQGAARRPLQRRGRARQSRRAALVHARPPQRAGPRVPARRAARRTRSSTAPTATTS